MNWIYPKCLSGYRVACQGVGRIERTAEGEKQGCPEPIVGNCIQSEGLCWWVGPIGFGYSMTLPVTNIKKFWQEGS